MLIEIIVTLAIVFVAGYILFKSLKKKSIGGCECGSCSSHCPSYNKNKK